MTIDWTPILTPIILAVATAIAGFLSIAAKSAIDKYGTMLDAQTKAQLDVGIDRLGQIGVHAGIMAAQDLIKAQGLDHVETQSKIIAEGAKYIISKFPETLGAAGVDLDTPAGASQAGDLVKRSIPLAASGASINYALISKAPTP